MGNPMHPSNSTKRPSMATKTTKWPSTLSLRPGVLVCDRLLFAASSLASCRVVAFARSQPSWSASLPALSARYTSIGEPGCKSICPPRARLPTACTAAIVPQALPNSLCCVRKKDDGGARRATCCPASCSRRGFLTALLGNSKQTANTGSGIMPRSSGARLTTSVNLADVVTPTRSMNSFRMSGLDSSGSHLGFFLGRAPAPSCDDWASLAMVAYC
mmetsp:Transcript_30528/g.67000  ORF Transcript_30528/g.67000 Transcript_30528/m.67000 type:complete len:216 (+) Transcript_30528:804-1451(+)